MTTDLLTSPDLLPADAVYRRASRIFAPPPELTGAEWAATRRMMGSDVAAQTGNWENENAPYLVEPMVVCTDEITREVTIMKPAQWGGTEVLLNFIGYRVDLQPGPMLFIAEDGKKSEAFSKERFIPMIASTPCLREKVSDGKVKSRHSDNTIGFKRFPGGYLAIVNAGSEAALSSRPIRDLIMDECDKYKKLKAGRADKLAIKRTATFWWNKKIIRVSSPRDRESSIIEPAYEESDKRKFYVPCPHCGHEQVLRHERLKWNMQKADTKRIAWAWYECEACDKQIEQYHRRAMLRKGKWKAERPFDGHAGFRDSALTPLWIDWKEYAKESMLADVPGNVEGRKTFVNEWKAETWEPGMAADLSIMPFLERREDYTTVPMDAGIITIGVDIQKYWIEAQVTAFGVGRQNWGIDHALFPGQPHLLSDTKELPEVWQRLDEYLGRSWLHESGAMMTPLCICIDMGFLTDEVLKFCKPRRHRNIFPTKGMSQAKYPLIGRPNRNNRMRVLYFPIGPDAAKRILFSNLEIEQPGPGYMHWTKKRCDGTEGDGNFDEKYFDQLLRSERPETVSNITRYVKVSSGARNEAVDLNVMCLAGFEIMRADPKGFVERYKTLAKQRADKGTGGQGEGEAMVVQEQKRTRRRVRSGGVWDPSDPS